MQRTGQRWQCREGCSPLTFPRSGLPSVIHVLGQIIFCSLEGVGEDCPVHSRIFSSMPPLCLLEAKCDNQRYFQTCCLLGKLHPTENTALAPDILDPFAGFSTSEFQPQVHKRITAVLQKHTPISGSTSDHWHQHLWGKGWPQDHKALRVFNYSAYTYTLAWKEVNINL